MSHEWRKSGTLMFAQTERGVLPGRLAKGEQVTFLEESRRLIAERIRRAIEESGYSLTRIAQQMGVTKGAVSSWQTGAANVTAAQLRQLAFVLDKPPGYFFAEGDAPLPWREKAVWELLQVPEPEQSRVLALIRAFTKPLHNSDYGVPFHARIPLAAVS
jgi:transcriptional regulator with XRE-family HTH domain